MGLVSFISLYGSQLQSPKSQESDAIHGNDSLAGFWRIGPFRTWWKLTLLRDAGVQGNRLQSTRQDTLDWIIKRILLKKVNVFWQRESQNTFFFGGRCRTSKIQIKKSTKLRPGSFSLCLPRTWDALIHCSHFRSRRGKCCFYLAKE